MPRRTDIQKILIIGSGPIVIGQACESDYSGSQACKALREEGYTLVLINSNPATIMTDPDMAQRTYIEPGTAEICENIIEAEEPDAIQSTLGGQTPLNIAEDLQKAGLKIIGTSPHFIDLAEDRGKFQQLLSRLRLRQPPSRLASSLTEAREAASSAIDALKRGPFSVKALQDYHREVLDRESLTLEGIERKVS